MSKQRAVSSEQKTEGQGPRAEGQGRKTGKIIDIEIHSLQQVPFIYEDGKGNFAMKMVTKITEQEKKLNEKEKEKNDASNDS